MRLRKFLAAALVGAVALAAAVSIASGAPGDLDPGFNGSGKRVIDFGGNEVANAVAVQPDGKILLAGRGPTGKSFTVLRLTPSGTLDTSFGGSGTGMASIDLGSAAQPYAMTIAPDGKIVVAGAVGEGTGHVDAAVARFSADGIPDTGFAPQGWRDVDFQGDDDKATGVAVRPDGKIILVGAGGSGPRRFVIALLNSTGHYDPGFPGGGLTTIPGTDGGDADAVALQPDGKFVVVGVVYTSHGADMGVARVKSDGTPDSGFDGDGVRLIDSGADEAAEAVALQPDGKVLVAGYTNIASFALVRLNTDGSPDNDFNGDGRVDIAFASGTRAADGIALQPDGKIVLAGKAEDGFGFARVQPGGAVDTTFSGDGRQVVLFNSNSNDGANGVGLEPDGGIVAAGLASGGPTEPAPRDIGVVKLQGDPTGGSGVPGGGGPGGGAAALKCAGKRATIVGTNGRNKLKGTRRADVIVGLGGGDKISGGGGNDLICGGKGNDALSGGSGKDKVYGQAGKDSVSGGAGNDTLSGGAGKDKLSGGAGKDKLNGNAGQDRLSGGSGKDRCSGHDHKSSC
ncbi:MAG TPA: hypothetical protein VH817_04945 [Thermoleophilaceae bacterium]|jgi:uncharacterized delta-60 repeat protein